MATTVQQSFLQLKSNLEITGLQSETVSTRQTRVREVMEAGMQVKDTFLTGSYARNTMISPLKEADIDIFCVLDNRYFNQYNGQNGGPPALLDYVRSTLLKTYKTTPSISRNGQAVTIRFTDFVVDVVVGFYRQGGGYLIPNSVAKSWLSTDPKKHVELVSAANKYHNGNLVPIIKMLKAWNKSHGSFFRSFHIEVSGGKHTLFLEGAPPSRARLEDLASLVGYPHCHHLCPGGGRGLHQDRRAKSLCRRRRRYLLHHRPGSLRHHYLPQPE
jgi:Second Messenger Oligonucleotide or Dinucleotide Synthetase domain